MLIVFNISSFGIANHSSFITEGGRSWNWQKYYFLKKRLRRLRASSYKPARSTGLASPRHFFLRKNFDVSIWEAGQARLISVSVASRDKCVRGRSAEGSKGAKKNVDLWARSSQNNEVLVAQHSGWIKTNNYRNKCSFILLRLESTWWIFRGTFSVSVGMADWIQELS